MTSCSLLFAGLGHLIPLLCGGYGGVPTAAEPELHRFEFESKHMGTTFRIVALRGR